MPPLIAAVGAAVTAIQAFTIGGFAVGSFALNTALAVGLSFAAKALTPKPKLKSPSISGDQSSLVTIRDPLAPRRVVYGRTRVAGTIVYLTTSVQSTYLHLVVALCEGPIDAIESIILNDEVVTFDGSGFSNSGTYAGGYVRVEQFLGTDTQTASASLIAESGGAWTAAHQLKGVAYLYVRLAWNQSVWSTGLPNITAIVRGRPVYDPRSTATAWTQNAALILRDFLTLPPAKGGVGALSSEIDDTSFSAAANTCDESVTLKDSTTEPRFTAAGVLELGDGSSPQDIMQSLLTACGGKLSFWGGKWRLVVAAWRSPTFTVTDSIMRGAIKVETRISRRDQFNAIKGSYPSPADRYVAKDYPAITSATFEAQDGGARSYRNLDFSWTTSASMAQRLAKIELYRSRLPITVQVQCTLAAYAVVVGDVINLTHAKWGWTNKTFEVIGVDWANDNGALGIDLTLRESNSAVFDWLASEQQLVTASPSTSFPSWNAPESPTISLAAGDSELFIRLDGSVESRLKVTIVPGSGSGLADRWEVRWKLSSDATWTEPINIGASGTNTYWISPIDDGNAYDVEARAVTAIGGRSAWSGVYGFVALGKSTPPADIATLTLVNTVLKWDYTRPADFAGFQVRYQSGSYAYWPTANPVHSALLSAGQIDVGSILSGTQTFLVKAIDTSGNESVNAAQLVVNLGNPVTANVVYSYDYRANSFPGTIGSGAIDGSSNLSGTSTSLWWNSNPKTPMWPSTETLFWPVSGGSFSDVVYTFTFTMDPAYTGSAISLNTNIVGFPWSITYKADGATAFYPYADSAVWWAKADAALWWDVTGGFQPWPGRLANASVATYTFQITATGGPAQPSISGLQLIVDQPSISETIASFSVSSAGDRLPITRTYRAITSVQVTVQGTGTAVTARAADKSTTGPLIQAFDATGTPVAAVIDATVQGY